MKRFTLGERVTVHRAFHFPEPIDLPDAPVGTVTRMRHSDDGAWIALDERSTLPVHQFPADDARGTTVLAFPEDCEPAA